MEDKNAQGEFSKRIQGTGTPKSGQRFGNKDSRYEKENGQHVLVLVIVEYAFLIRCKPT